MTFSGSPETDGEVPRVIIGMHDDTFDGTISSLEDWRAEGHPLSDELVGYGDSKQRPSETIATGQTLIHGENQGKIDGGYTPA